jgi:hypothetical protein
VMWLVWLPKFCSWCLVNLGCSWWLINRRSRSLQTYITYSIYIYEYMYIYIELRWEWYINNL